MLTDTAGTPLTGERFLSLRGSARYRPIEEVTPLREGAETYPAMLAAIGAARHTICLEVYIFADDATGLRFAKALAERARAGVTVRVIYDGVGSVGIGGPVLDTLNAAGVQSVEFHPIAPWRQRWNLSHRDHRKILVVDDEVAFVGGLNIGNDYAARSDGGNGWHDMHCRVRGPVVHDLARLFRRVWLRQGGANYPAPTSAAAAPGSARPPLPLIRMLEGGPRMRRADIRAAYLRALAVAASSVQIKNAYFLPDRALRRAMVRLVKRGVTVDVIVPSQSDVRLVEWASLYVYKQMTAQGVRIWRWRGPMMHAKTAVIDATWATIGSCNLDARSFRYNLEVAVECVDAKTGAQLATNFIADREHCDEFAVTSWQRLSWLTRAAAWCAYRLRRWL